MESGSKVSGLQESAPTNKLLCPLGFAKHADSKSKSMKIHIRCECKCAVFWGFLIASLSLMKDFLGLSYLPVCTVRWTIFVTVVHIIVVIQQLVSQWEARQAKLMCCTQRTGTPDPRSKQTQGCGSETWCLRREVSWIDWMWTVLETTQKGKYRCRLIGRKMQLGMIALLLFGIFISIQFDPFW